MCGQNGLAELVSHLAAQHGSRLQHRRDLAARHVSVPQRLPGVCVQDGVPRLNVAPRMLNQSGLRPRCAVCGVYLERSLVVRRSLHSHTQPRSLSRSMAAGYQTGLEDPALSCLVRLQLTTAAQALTTLA